MTRTVLVVDDQAPFRSVVRTLVSLLPGWSLAGEAQTGEDGVALALRLRPDLVLMDVNLPGIGGPEATRRIVAEAPGIAVVLVSTYGPDDLPADALTCGARSYLPKEFLTPETLQTLS